MENLINKLLAVIDAKAIHDKELQSYDGYSWSYHGYRFTAAVDCAAAELKESLKEVIIEVIKEERIKCFYQNVK